MTSVREQQWNGLVGLGLLVFMGPQLFEGREEEMVMKMIILIIIAALGLLIPLFWIIGTATGFTYFGLHGLAKRAKESRVVLNPRLGLTMADGGDPIEQDKKE